MTRKTIVIAFAVLISLLIPAVPGLRAEDVPAEFRSTDLPLPRFVSLASDKIYVRTGPGVRYPIQWVYKRKDLPVEIILEYETWRKIRDADGDGGWVHQSLLSGKRTGMIQEGESVPIRSKPSENARLLAYIEPQVVAEIEECRAGWCQVQISGYKGWMERKHIWGIYENENFD